MLDDHYQTNMDELVNPGVRTTILFGTTFDTSSFIGYEKNPLDKTSKNKF